MRDRYENGCRAQHPGRWGGAGLLWTQRLLAGLLVLGGVADYPLRAQTNTPRAPRPPARYLLIVETSKSMQPRAATVLSTVWYLLGSGLDGQFRNGGTLGVWTFNQDLSAGNLPLQTWSSSAQKDITQRTISFLKGQKYGKRPKFDEVAPALRRVIEASEALTVVLITSGDCKIQGTPFNEQVNAAYQQFRGQQQKAHMPFVTVLRARHGQVVDYIVNTPPWPLQVPRLPEEGKSVEAPHGKPLEALHDAPASAAPPLIVSGKKPQPEPAPVPKPAAAPAKTEPLPALTAATVTNERAVVQPPEPAVPPVKIAKVEPAPVVPAKPANEPVPAPQVASEPKAETVKAPEVKAAEPAPVKPEAISGPPAPGAKPQPAPAITESPPPAVAATVPKEPAVVKRPEPAPAPVEVAKVEPAPIVPTKPATEPAPKPVPAPKAVSEPKAEPAKAPEAKATEAAASKPEAVLPPPAPKPKPEPVISEQPKPSATPAVKPVLAPAPAAIPEPLPAVMPIAAANQVTTSNSSSLAPPPSSRPVPPAQSATAAPGESLLRNRNLWIAAVLLAVVVVGFAFLLKRRSRPVPQGSLITRSFEREKRP